MAFLRKTVRFTNTYRSSSTFPLHFIQVLLGPLPESFLRTDGTPDSAASDDADYQAALALQQQLCGATVSNILTLK